MQVKIKKLVEEAVIPSYAKKGDAGMDLTAVSKKIDSEGNIVYGTGLAFEIPEGYVGLLFPRSSNAERDMLLCNSVGVVDSGYRGEVKMKFKPIYNAVFGNELFRENSDKDFNIGERIGQILIMPYPQIEFVVCDNLSDTERGDGGFGHSGVK